MHCPSRFNVRIHIADILNSSQKHAANVRRVQNGYLAVLVCNKK